MFYAQLSDVLEESYKLISKVEETMVHSATRLNLTINEIHLLEAAARGGENGIPVSDIAAILSLPPPSVTVAVKKLEKKGYVTRERDEEDGRVVNVRLTPEGVRVNKVHRRFHRSMAIKIAQDFSEEEKQVFLRGLDKMNRFLKQKVEKLEDTSK